MPDVIKKPRSKEGVKVREAKGGEVDFILTFEIAFCWASAALLDK